MSNVKKIRAGLFFMRRHMGKLPCKIRRLFTIHHSLFIILLFIGSSSFAQMHDSSIFNYPVQMDEVTIKAAREGWDVSAFIKRVKDDTTFYKAFRSLHLVPYTAVNDIKIFNGSGGVQASLHSTTQQFREKNCRTMKVLDEHTTGDYYKRDGDYNYYTAELYASLFFTKQPVCGEDDIVAGGIKEGHGSRMEKNKNQLKQLIFNPGSSVQGVPFVGNKAAIFDPEISKRYNFKLLSVDYDGEDCYLFQAIPKPEYASDVVYNELSTWFRKSDYAIVARNYSLSYHTMIFDFDVSMKVRLRNAGGRLLPGRIEYKGNWRVMTKGRERGAFVAAFTY